MEPLIIVGSGLAGYTVAREFRKYDKTTQIIMVTQDSGDFYSKPMLSNAFAQKKSAEQLVASPAQTMVEQINMTLLAHAQLQAIDTVQREVATSLGRYRYGKLVLALGADPVRLPLAGNAAERVLSVNDLRDYAQFRAKLGNAKRVVVIGAGLIGCEFANDLLAAGIVPTVVDPSPYPLSSLLPEVAATAVRKALEAAGVVWRFGTTVASVDVDTPADAEQGDGLRVRLSDGSELQADLVLSAVGLRPRTALAAAAGIAVQRGIVVDAHGRTCAEDVYALGDCAEYADGVLPYVLPIMTAARAIAQTLAGTPTPIVFAPMPVSVKTPAHPVSVQPVKQGADGAWEIAVSEDSGLKLLFTDAAGQVRGFVLTGSRTAERAAVVKMLA
jgi:rubredoxin-NAD+ reductase